MPVRLFHLNISKEIFNKQILTAETKRQAAYSNNMATIISITKCTLIKCKYDCSYLIDIFHVIMYN